MLESQGWNTYRKAGNIASFKKEGVNGIIVNVDVVTGKAEINAAAPQYYIEEHAPKLS